MKPDKREEARRLQRDEGLAISDICKLLGVAKRLVSTWVRDIELIIVVRIMCYLSDGINQNEIGTYWCELLNVPQERLRKTTVHQPASSLQVGRGLLHGTCELAVQGTLIPQHILGAIQEYAGIEKPEWLM